MLRAAVTFLTLLSASLPAFSDEWASRSGTCFDWQAYWNVERESSGVFTGFIDLVHVGGPCAAANDTRASANARAVIVGSDFFAITNAGGSQCLWYGTILGEQARGFASCPGSATASSFVLSFKRAN
jgi:hypothetical protein